MDELKKMLQNIQEELTQQKQDIKNMEENIKDAINKNIDDKFSRFETKTNELEQKIEKQQKSIDFLEKQMRKKNVIFFGVPEKENNYEDLLKSILDIINTTMRIACPKWEIETVTRLGKYKNKTRPVVVTTTTTSRKLEILKQKKRLENTGIYIKEDYTPAVLIKRQELQEELQRRRTSGEKVMLRYDKIVQIKSRDKQTYATKSTNCNKRFLSESPETAHKEKEWTMFVARSGLVKFPSEPGQYAHALQLHKDRQRELRRQLEVWYSASRPASRGPPTVADPPAVALRGS
ncbi:hypothetical protein HF086_009776 [Spodoptera exigua]|uniref:Endonuclease-reverse transcriptase n=1 Tax=Spodoptera exigua TaxID=7107 RepID=A0A922SDG4_SPOEX|nr:hypothetical protein HF086_009776 [Spodoptera exigua]